MNHTQREGLLLLLVAAAGYSFFAIFTKIVYENGLNSPLDILIWRFVLTAPVIWGIIAVQRRNKRASSSPPPPRARLLAMGLLFGLVAMLAFFAVARLPASLYTVLIYTYPAMVALGALLFGERLSALGWGALGLTLLGVFLTVPNPFSGLGEVDPLGVLFVFLNALSYATYILLSSRILRGQRDQTLAGAWSITGSLLYVLVLLVARGVTLPPNPTVWAALLALALFSTALPIVAFYAGMQRLGAAKASILSTIEPVMTVLWAVLLLGETLLPAQLVGGALVIASVVLLQVRRPTPEKRKNSAAAPVALEGEGR
ncbi:MAG: EamA family transporter [Anaerolineae bacterium]|nr:EamA family transporter [Anaerolineae bacterium]